jgi:hypothetical protein
VLQKVHGRSTWRMPLSRTHCSAKWQCALPPEPSFGRVRVRAFGFAHLSRLVGVPSSRLGLPLHRLSTSVGVQSPARAGIRVSSGVLQIRT